MRWDRDFGIIDLGSPAGNPGRHEMITTERSEICTVHLKSIPKYATDRGIHEFVMTIADDCNERTDSYMHQGDPAPEDSVASVVNVSVVAITVMRERTIGSKMRGQLTGTVFVRFSTRDMMWKWMSQFQHSRYYGRYHETDPSKGPADRTVSTAKKIPC